MAKNRGNMPSDEALVRNAMDALVANIRFAGADRPVDTIVITSSIPDEGKSTVAVNLAHTLAEGSERVLLVECDVHRRSLAGMLGVRARTGMYSVLLERVTLEQAVVPTKTNNMFFLDCEPSIPNPANVFASLQFRNLVKRLRGAYDYVIFDTPPLSAYVDGAIVGSASDATLLVTRWDFVKRDDVRSALEQLRKADANVIGTVMNCCEPERDSYYCGNRGRASKTQSDGEAPRVAGDTSRGGGVQRADAAAAQQRAATPQPTAQQRPTSAPAAAQVQTQPQSQRPQQHVSPDSTAQFLINAGYAPAGSQSRAGAQPVSRGAVPPQAVRPHGGA